MHATQVGMGQEGHPQPISYNEHSRSRFFDPRSRPLRHFRRRPRSNQGHILVMVLTFLLHALLLFSLSVYHLVPIFNIYLGH